MKKQNRKLSKQVVRAAEPPVVTITSADQVVTFGDHTNGTEEQEPVIQAKEVIHCKAQGNPISAKKTWEVDKPIDFMWMPGGVHTIHASYGRSDSDQRPIELTVHCNEEGAHKVQSAFDSIRANNSRRPPFICIEHRAQERAGEPIGFEWRTDPEPAIYCRCHPSALGANNVNGKIHTSFSPTFDTDAEYHKMRCTGCEKTPSVCACESGAGWYFPDGARGSSSNPAHVTAPDVQSVGSLTNWNAFRDMLPIAARENRPVEAAGTSEGVKKSWEKRHEGSSEKWKKYGKDAAEMAHNSSDGALAHRVVFHHSKYGGEQKDMYHASAAELSHRGKSDLETGHNLAEAHEKKLEAMRQIAQSSASPEHKKAAIDAINKATSSEFEDLVVKATKQDLAVRAEQDPLPENPNAEQHEEHMKLKVKFVRAHDTFKVGDVAELDANHPAILAGDALVPAAADVVLARETELATVKAREKETAKARIISACERGVTRGALVPAGETPTSRPTVEARMVGRFERGECTADICVEQVDAMPVIQAADPGRQTSSDGRGAGAVDGGEVSGHELARAVLRACEPFQKKLSAGGIVMAAGRGESARTALVEALVLSREKTRLLARLDGEIRGGFVVRAATLNYVDPAGSNPLGLLNTELMVLNNLGHLENQLAPIRDLTTNLTGTPVAFNQQVRTRYFAIPKVQLKTSTSAWSTNQTGSNTDVNVKLDTYAGVPISFENTMLASSPRALFREQYDPQLYGLGEYILYKLINTIFNGNTRISNDDSTTATIKFQDNANNVMDISGATLRTFVSDLPAKLDSLKMPGGDEPPGAADLMRFAWVHTNPYAAATADTNFVLNQSIQSVRPGGSTNGNVMETGLFERLGNLKFRKSQLMADSIGVTGSGADATTNGISVDAPDYAAATNVGFAGTRSSLLFVSRVPEDYTQVLPNIPSTAAIETVTSPQLGITFLIVKYLDHTYEIANARVQLMFGFAIGDERQGCLLYKA